jgi:hypothetical protein
VTVFTSKSGLRGPWGKQEVDGKRDERTRPGERSFDAAAGLMGQGSWSAGAGPL